MPPVAITMMEESVAFTMTENYLLVSSGINFIFFGGISSMLNSTKKSYGISPM